MESLYQEERTGSPVQGFNDLLPAIQRLDLMLERAIGPAEKAYGSGLGADPFRGLHISRDEVDRLLARKPGASVLQTEGKSEGLLPEYVREDSRWAWLKQAFGLSLLDLDILLIALAPELDLRYERLYAYLQDDVTRRWPTIDLALNLLCSSSVDKLGHRSRFSSDSPLIRHGLIYLVPDTNRLQPPFLDHFIKIDEQIRRLLLYEEGLDSRLLLFSEVIYPAYGMNHVALGDETKRALSSLAIRVHQERQPLQLYFQGPRGVGKRMVAEATAFETRMPLLVADLSRVTATTGLEFAGTLRVLFREAWFKDAILYLDETDALFSEERAISYHSLLETLIEDSGITILAGIKPWKPSGYSRVGVIEIPFTIFDLDQQRRWWNASLAAEGISVDENCLDALASRFKLTQNQIASAVISGKNRSQWNSAASAGEPGPDMGNGSSIKDFFAAARAQSGHDLAALARKVEPKYTWDDIVLPQDTITQLREMCQWVAHRHRVLGEWGFDSKLSQGKGVNALFAGPSGTGKTMAAEVIANELGLDLYRIDLSRVVDKYIGETEKNLNRIFTAAENANAILFFDEADALFGKRTEVRDSHDRFANIEISYLLQKMEEYEGLAILTTNIRQNLDDAFMRRLAFIVHFPFPDEQSRRRIWEGIWPAATPRSEEVDLDFLARQFKLSGGNIKNIGLAAAYLAAADGGMVNMEHLLRAAQREFQKMGKNLSTDELCGNYGCSKIHASS